MESAPHTPNQSTQETHVLRPDEGVEMPPTLENPQGPVLHFREVLRPGKNKLRAFAATATAAFALNAAMPTDAEAGDKHGLEAFARSVAVNVVNQRLSTTPAQVGVTPDGRVVVVPNANMQIAPEIQINQPGVQEYLQAAGLEVSRHSPLFIRVIGNEGSGVEFEPDTEAVILTRNATGLDIHRHFKRGGVPYVSVTPARTEIITQNGTQTKRFVLGQKVEGPVFVKK